MKRTKYIMPLQCLKKEKIFEEEKIKKNKWKNKNIEMKTLNHFT